MKSFLLTEITTKDGLVHQGIFFKPQKPGKRALLWIHGLAGRFYGDVPVMNELAEACEKEGFGFASFNNRGHDMVASAKKDGAYITIGSGNERFEDCVLDIEAAVAFLVDNGFSEIILVGNSTGANKACYYGVVQDDARISGIVLSGPLSDRYSGGYSPEKYEEYKQFMQEKIKEGRGDELLVGYDFFPLSPNRWMSLYVDGASEDVFNYFDGENALMRFSKIIKPILILIGQKDEHADGKVQEIRASFDSHATSKNYKSVIIPDANHGFDGKEQDVVDAIMSWIKNI